MSKTKYLVMTLMIYLIGQGCASNMVARKSSNITIPDHPRIAVLPFENLSGKEKVGMKITEYFQTLMLMNKHYEIVELGNMYETLRKLRIRSSSLINENQIDSLAKRLKIDFIFTGSVMEYEEYKNQYLGKVPEVSFNCHLIDCRTKNTVWASALNSRGDKGEIIFGLGAVRSADELAKKMVVKTIKKLDKFFKK